MEPEDEDEDEKHQPYEPRLWWDSPFAENIGCGFVILCIGIAIYLVFR